MSHLIGSRVSFFQGLFLWAGPSCLGSVMLFKNDGTLLRETNLLPPTLSAPAHLNFLIQSLCHPFLQGGFIFNKMHAPPVPSPQKWLRMKCCPSCPWQCSSQWSQRAQCTLSSISLGSAGSGNSDKEALTQGSQSRDC